MKKIIELKKDNKFKFNDNIFIVVREWINIDKPLIARNEHPFFGNTNFENEDMYVELLP